MKRLFHQILLWSCLAASTAIGLAQTLKISPDLLRQLSNTSGSVNVIVQYNSNSGSSSSSNSGGGGLLGGVLGLVGGILGGSRGLITGLGGVVT